MNSSPARVEILWPKQVIWLPRPQIKLVWFNFRFGAIQQPYITADIFHYPAKAGGGWGQGCRSPQEDIIALLWHTFSRSHSLPPSYNRAIYNTQTHRAVTAHARERVRYIQIIVIVPVRSVRDDVNSIIATVSEGECVCACVCETNVRLLLHANRRVTQNCTSRSVCLWELLFVSLVTDCHNDCADMKNIRAVLSLVRAKMNRLCASISALGVRFWKKKNIYIFGDFFDNDN